MRRNQSTEIIKERILHKNAKDLSGRKIGKLLIKNPVHKNGKTAWTAICDCGNETIVLTGNVLFGYTQSCGCLHSDVTRLRTQKALGVNAGNWVWSYYKRNAKNRNLDWKLTTEQFFQLIKQDCHYCDAKPKNKFENKRVRGPFIYNGIDRVDNVKGYIFDNCVPCCKICNRAKDVLSVEEFTEWVMRISNKILKTV